jgi:tetratricopeptide (TPR) repeat protein
MFVQSLIREVAHGRISKEARRRRHLEVASHLQTLGPELAPMVASHFMDAYAAASGPEAEQLRQKALDALLAASDRAAGLHSYDQARTLAERALEAAADDGERAPIWERIAAAASWMAEREPAIEHADRAIGHYRAAGDHAGVNRAVALLGQVLNDGNLSARAIDLLQSHLEGKDLTSDPHLAAAAGSLARAMLLDGRPPQLTADTAEAALPALEAFELTDPLANALVSRGTALADLGRPRQAMALINGGLKLADDAGLAATSIRARINMAYSSWVESPSIAFRAHEEAYAIAKRTGQRHMLLFLSPLLGFWYIHGGELDQAEAVATSRDLEDAPDDYRGQLLGVRAYCAALRGDGGSAAALFEQSASLAAASEDLQVREGNQRLEHTLQLLRCDLEGAYTNSLQLHRESSLTPLAQIRAAMDAAMWMGDRKRLQEILESLTAVGASTHSYRRMVESVIAVVANPSAASLALASTSLEEFDDRVDRLEGTHLAGAVAAQLSPGPDRERWENEFRARADKWGYQGLLDLYLRVTSG